METIVTVERCYRCLSLAGTDAGYCSECGLPLDRAAFLELTSLDFVRATIARWQTEGAIHPILAERLTHDIDGQYDRILALLVRRQRPPRNAAIQELLPLAETKPEPPPSPPSWNAPPPPRPIEKPLPVAPSPAPPVVDPAPVRDQRSWDASSTVVTPRRLAPQRAADTAMPRTEKRPLLDVLLDASTLRLMLYAGAVMLAIGTLLYLRDILREQLARPEVQAGLLVLATGSILGTGIALVHRAGENLERKLLGRAFLFLGTLLVPLTPWFFVRAGLVESHGNAWVVAVLCFLLCTAIAFGLGERAYVFLSFLSAVVSGWLIAFKTTGAVGTAPGVYALVLAAISGVYVHAERVVAQRGAGRRWERLGGPFFLCGHIGIALTLLFYTNLVPFLPPEVIAAFKHFDSSGYSPWIGAAVALVAAEIYLYSAHRRQNALYSYFGIGSALWSVALWLRAQDVPPGIWLVACGAASLALLAGCYVFRDTELWSVPMARVAWVLAWIGFVACAAPVAAIAFDLVDVRWFTMVGVTMVLCAFVIHAASTGRGREAFPVPILAFGLLAYVLDEMGLERVYAHAILALVVAVVPIVALRLLGAHEGAREGVLLASSSLAGLFVFGALAWAAAKVDTSPGSAVPVSIASAVALGVHAWGVSNRVLRFVLFGISTLLLHAASILGALGVVDTTTINGRFTAFLLAPVPYLFALAWAWLRARGEERALDLAWVARASVSFGAFVAACAIPALAWNAVDAYPTGLVAAFAFALVAAPVVAVSLAEAKGAAATAEAVFAALLAIAGYLCFTDWVANSLGHEKLIFAVAFGSTPLLFTGIRRLAQNLAPAVSRGAGWVGDASSVLLVASSATIALVGSFDARPSQNSERIVLASLLALGSLIRLGESRGLVWSILLSVSALVTVHEALMASTNVELAALAVTALGGALLVASRLLRSRFGGTIEATFGVVAHELGILGLAHALSVQTSGVPVSWFFVTTIGTLAAGYGAAAFASERGSYFDAVHRLACFAVGFATTSAALHALGRMAPTAQAEPLALLLVTTCAVALLLRSEWFETFGLNLAHVLVLVLLIAIALEYLFSPSINIIWEGGGPWSLATFGRFAFELAVFYAISSIRRESWTVALGLVSFAVSLLAFGAHLGVDPSIRIIVFVALAALAGEIVSRLANERFMWLRRPIEGATHVVYFISLVTASSLLFEALDRRTLGIPNVALGQPVATFATLAACARLLADPSRGGDAAPAYSVLARILPFVAYGILGLRLGFHPWHDTAFYTLPAGAVIVALGIVATRRDERGTASLLWTGSLICALPLLLHALENRFVTGSPPFAYDAATMGVGIALVATGVLLQLKAPSVVGAVAFCTDAFVVAFARIEWSEIPLAIYSAAVGGALFGFGWLLLYRREQLRRVLDTLARRREAFARWR